MDASDPDLRHGELRESLGELRAAGAEAEEITSGLTREQLSWRPEPDAWSIAECLDHLVRTGEAYLEVLDEAIEDGRGRELRPRGEYRPSLVGRWLPGFLEPPPGLKIPAPRRIRPRPPEPGGSPPGNGGHPIAAFLEMRQQLARRVRAADDLDIARIRVPSPFVPLLRFDLGSAFRVIAAHERRHLYQARRVRETEGFPV